MCWVMVALVYISLLRDADSEVGHFHQGPSGQYEYHHHAHYKYEPLPGGNHYNHTVMAGEEAVLRCRLKGLAGRKISWVRRSDWHILSSNHFLYITDKRFRVDHSEGSDRWNLHISPVQAADNGTYECQVTDGEVVLSTFIHLRVKQPRAVIRGARQYHMVPGSSFHLHCAVIETEFPVKEVVWRRDNFTLVADPEGIGLTLNTTRGQTNTTSELSLPKVGPQHSGVYSCRGKGAAADQVKVFVDNADKTAAISRRNSTAARPASVRLLWLVPPLVCLLPR